MQSEFIYLGPLHAAILTAIPTIAGILALLAKYLPGFRSGIRWGLATVLVGNDLIYYTYLGLWDPPKTADNLPLQLCNITVWLTALALTTRKQPFVEAAWYLGAFGPTLGLLVPQLWAPVASYPTIQFFVGHAGVLVSILYLATAGEARPTVRGAVFSFGALNGIALVLGALNTYLGTNYMFLRDPPSSPIWFSYLAPPMHIFAGEIAAIAAFTVLALPFWDSRQTAGEAGAVTDRSTDSLTLAAQNRVHGS